MTKRICPFEDNHFLVKTHIRQKEVNLGVNGFENMKRVYATTHKLLFDGAAKWNQRCLSKKPEIFNGNGCPVESNSQKSDSCHSNNEKGQKFDSNRCCSIDPKFICFFCEKHICGSCSRACLSCNNIFCPLCSILKYDLKDESAICLSCR